MKKSELQATEAAMSPSTATRLRKTDPEAYKILDESVLQKSPILYEELTTAMHNELKISRSLELKNRCFSLLTLIPDAEKNPDFLYYCDIYDVTPEDVEDNKEEYFNQDA